MKVKTWQNIDVEVEADISFDQILDVFREMQEQSTRWQQVGSVLDVMTRIMADIPDDIIGKFPEHAIKVFHERFCAQAARFQELVNDRAAIWSLDCSKLDELEVKGQAKSAKIE